VPPHKVAELGRATWNNVEQFAIEFVTDCIVPMALRMEQEANIKLYGRNNRGTIYTKLNIAGLLRGDMKARYDSYAVGRQWGWLSANDCRELEDLNPIPNGNVYLSPANMTTPELIKKGPAKAPEPQPNEPNPIPDAPKARLNGSHANGAGHA
jgi:phage portal protein BeeE